MCNKCLCKPVCGIYRATGGNVKACEHHREERRGHWERTDSTEFHKGDFECSECEHLECDIDTEVLEPGVNCLLFCPNCGADMRRQKVPGDCHAAGGGSQ